MNTGSNTEHIALSPILHHWVTGLLSNHTALLDLINNEGSPVNIHCLQPFTENLEKYRSVLKKYDLRHRIYFARKANKCLEFAQQSFASGECVDTASYNELKQCLDTGIEPRQLILTAAIKTRDVLTLAVKNKVTVVLDNDDEFELLKEVTTELQTPVTVNIRLGGFYFKGKKLHSRFGFSLKQAFALILKIHHSDMELNYSGLHFHLNGYSVAERAAAIEQCVELIDQLKEKNIPTHSLDIGGGFLVNYLEEKSQWQTFFHELKRASLGKRPPITYRNDALGMVKIGGELYGEPSVYPYYNNISKEKFLEGILQTPSEKYGKPIYALIKEQNLELRMEPGRSLLDQAGITVARVAFRKKDSEGNLLAGLEMNRTQLRSSSADFLLDPIHIPRQENAHTDRESCYGFLVGGYCLEQELILKRKIRFDQFPEIGDLIVFPNTAGYMMHFFESEAHLFPLAKNVFVQP